MSDYSARRTTLTGVIAAPPLWLGLGLIGQLTAYAIPQTVQSLILIFPLICGISIILGSISAFSSRTWESL
jgi:hypothetical protein